MSKLTDSDIAFIKGAPVSELREELYYATGRDDEYAAALAKEIISRQPAQSKEGAAA